MSGRRPGGQKPSEDCKMEVDGEADKTVARSWTCGKKITKQLREVEEIRDMDEDVRENWKDNLRQELVQIKQ